MERYTRDEKRGVNPLLSHHVTSLRILVHGKNPWEGEISPRPALRKRLRKNEKTNELRGTRITQARDQLDREGPASKGEGR